MRIPNASSGFKSHYAFLGRARCPSACLKQTVPTKMLSVFSVSKHGILQTLGKKNYDLIGLLCCLSSKGDSFLVLMLAFVLDIKSVQGRCGSFSAWKECGGMRTVPHLSLKSALGEKATAA